jgi:Excreted virulence factor EspC, type VII ESX diderm
MAGFSVDTEVLKSLSRQVSRVAVDLLSADDPSPLDAGETGNGDVARALEKFHAHWTGEKDKLVESLHKIGNAVSQSATAYDQADLQVSTAASGGELTVGTAGPSGTVSPQ